MSNHTGNPLQLPEHIKAMPEDEKRARKAWLKQKFGSFEYHEEMLRLHHGFVETLRRALARAVHDNSPDPDYGTKAAFARNFEKTDWPLIQANDDLGKIPKDQWERIRHAATFRSIPDYNRYLNDGDRLAWLNEQENLELGRYWGAMARMAENIARTVEDDWGKYDDDILLSEEYTGPITWPANWREELAEPIEAASPPPSTPAGQPCPREGWWFTPAKAHSRRHFQAGEPMPDFATDWGQVIWQWDANQNDQGD